MLVALTFWACTGGLGLSEVVVSPIGADTNPGTNRQPVATLQAAVERVRALHCHAIVVRSGAYRLTTSLKLDQRDDGLTIRAEKNRRPQVVGGIQIPLSAVHPCTDPKILNRILDPSARSKVLEVDLKSLGIANIAPLVPRGFPHSGITGPTELFEGDQPMTLARWPNTGFAKVGKVTEAGNGERDHDKPARQPVFTIGDRPKHWLKAEDPWMYGYWKYDWADESIKVSRIDPTTGGITLETPAVYGVDPATPFFAENLLEELDAPGEYYIDRMASRIYLIPIYPLTAKEPLTISMLDQPLISIERATGITIEGMDFGYSRGVGIVLKDCGGVRIRGCRFMNLGSNAANIEGGSASGLQSCDIWNMAEGGVRLSGGDRGNLKPAHNFVDNCDFGNFERRSQTYRPAVWIEGVGNRVSHCYMHDAPHSAIIYGGNDHQIEFNRFSRLLSLTGDGGVVYTGRNWTARGTAINNNWFEDDFGQRKWEPAIYVDDLGSGIKMIDNLIERCHWGFLIGGGRDNILQGNVLVDCDLAFDCDARGLGWAASSRPTMEAGLKAVPYQSPIWQAAYPNLPNILNENPMAPAANVLRENTLIHAGTVMKQMEDPFKKTATITGNIEESTPSPADLAKIKTMRSQAGLVKDPWRRSLPASKR